MKLTVRGHNLKITPAIRDYAEKKIGKYKGMFAEMIQVNLDLEVKKIKNKDKSHTASITLQLPQKIILRAQAMTGDMYASLDELSLKLEAPLKKYQDKLKDNHKKLGFVSRMRRKITQDFSDLIPEVRITRTPKAALKPMDPVEAVLQLNKSRESFYVFNNAKAAHQVSIVYDRHNGTYGLQTFKKLYLRRARLKKFKNLPADVRYDGGGVKITKIKDIEAKPMSLEDAAARLGNSRSKRFMTFLDTGSAHIKVIYKKKQPLSFGLIEPAM
ncbi:MAG: ribosome-associated translation inhibitor RaiA [Candidatus Margulisbacteria bacterium]|jgi:putative sigma-54 modulation protein|nr:ribosome-associated translation inhibitor RaiA [Candidatus Margulisiibacteriota bacterium]